MSAIEGTVLAGDRPAKAEVIVFTADASRWTYPSRFVRTASADEKGRFRITGLPPSERYLVVAADYLEDGEHFDPEFLERIRDIGDAVLARQRGNPRARIEGAGEMNACHGCRRSSS